MADHHPEPQPIPAPANFPITWDNPADAHLPLNQDKQHAETSTSFNKKPDQPQKNQPP
jgi:hypothetical protein